MNKLVSPIVYRRYDLLCWHSQTHTHKKLWKINDSILPTLQMLSVVIIHLLFHSKAINESISLVPAQLMDILKIGYIYHINKYVKKEEEGNIMWPRAQVSLFMVKNVCCIWFSYFCHFKHIYFHFSQWFGIYVSLLSPSVSPLWISSKK